MKRKLSAFLVLVVLVLGVGGPAGAGDKILVHHNGEDEFGEPAIFDICISVNALAKHIANHGDTTEFVECQGAPEVEPFEE